MPVALAFIVIFGSLIYMVVMDPSRWWILTIFLGVVVVFIIGVSQERPGASKNIVRIDKH
jgi:hypothetical protein